MVFFVLAIAGTAVAADHPGNLNGNFKVIEKHKEIKDIDKLLERAKNGVSDLDLDKKGLKKGILKNKQTGEKTEIPVHTTSQLLETRKYENGKTVKRYAINKISILDNKHFNNKSNKPSVAKNKNIMLASNFFSPELLLAYNDTKGSKSFDDTSTASCETTIYVWVEDEIKWDMEKVEGEWTVYRSGATVNDKSYRYCQTGSTGAHSVTQESPYYDVSDSELSFTDYVSTEWEPIIVEGAWHVIGCNTWATIHYDGDQWEFEHVGSYT